MKVLINLRSDLSGSFEDPSSADLVSGELICDGHSICISWTQPPDGEQGCKALYHLVYERPGGVLHLTRKGEHTTDLFFSMDACTKGTLATGYGDFSVEIRTQHLFVPDELWNLEDPDAVRNAVKERRLYISLRYLLYLSAQEPVQNDISIQIRFEKQ